MHKVSVLIIEDEAMVALEIKREIEKLGFFVTDIANNYTQALQSIHRARPDIMLVDIRLHGDESGIDLVITVQENQSIPHIYLTSDERESTIIQAASTKPSAYLNKPFRREELRSNLLITIHKIQNQTAITPALIPLGDHYLYDPVNQSILQDQEPLCLSINEKHLLKLLIESEGTTIPFKVIETHIWGNITSISESALRTLVYRLRSKLRELEIETVSGYGYRLGAL